MVDYIKANHADDVLLILNAEDTKQIPFVSLVIDLTLLKEKESDIFEKLAYRKQRVDRTTEVD